MTELGDYFVKATFDISGRRLKSDDLKRELARVEASMQQLVELGRQAAACAPAGFGSSTQAEPSDVQRLRTEWESLQPRQTEIVRELRILNPEILRRGIHHSLQYPTLLAKANLALRREMELPIDAVAYLALVEQSVATAREESERLMRQLDEMAARA